MTSLKSNVRFALESKVEINSQIRFYMETCKHCKALVATLGVKEKHYFLKKTFMLPMKSYILPKVLKYYCSKSFMVQFKLMKRKNLFNFLLFYLFNHGCPITTRNHNLFDREFQ